MSAVTEPHFIPLGQSGSGCSAVQSTKIVGEAVDLGLPAVAVSFVNWLALTGAVNIVGMGFFRCSAVFLCLQISLGEKIISRPPLIFFFFF